MVNENVIRDTIEQAIRTLGLERSVIDVTLGERRTCEQVLTKRHGIATSKCWWSGLAFDFGAQSVKGDAYLHLPNCFDFERQRLLFVPWDRELLGIYTGSVSEIVAIIGESIGFEYLVLTQDYGQLIGENHHDFLLAKGESVTLALKNIVAEFPAEWQNISGCRAK